MSSFEPFLFECEQEIRMGRSNRVAQRLMQLNLSKVPRPLCLRIANLCRRSGLFATGMKLLTPIVRPAGRIKHADVATHAERAEYAVLLKRLGATAEALFVLSEIDAAIVPEVSLYTSICLFSKWQYGESEPY